jgi:hypothetical protein
MRKNVNNEQGLNKNLYFEMKSIYVCFTKESHIPHGNDTAQC